MLECLRTTVGYKLVIFLAFALPFGVSGCAGGRGDEAPVATGTLQVQTENGEYRLEGVLGLRRIGDAPFLTELTLDGNHPSVALPEGRYEISGRNDWKLFRLSPTSETDVTNLIADNGIAIQPNPAMVTSGTTTLVTISIKLQDDVLVSFSPGIVQVETAVDDTELACGGCAAGDVCLSTGNGFHRCATPCATATDGTTATDCGSAECILHSVTVHSDGRETPVYACNRVVAVSAGNWHTCATRLNGTVVCWGDNREGQLGNGSSETQFTPVLGAAGVVVAESGGQHSCALRQFGSALESGTVACWGLGLDGQLGNGGFETSTVPVDTGIADAVAVSPGHGHTCALRLNGTVVCWGQGGQGQLGNNFEASAVPVVVPGLTDGTAVSVGGDHACAVRRDGRMACWGGGIDGQRGDGTYVTSPALGSVSGMMDAVAVSAGGGFTCALRKNGGIACWGDGRVGELGDGEYHTANAVPLPVPVAGITDAEAVSAGIRHSCALRRGGGIACWGSGIQGQLGNGGDQNSATPVPVSGIEDAVAVSAGGNHSCAILRTGDVVCWGLNGNGQVNGQASDATFTTPVLVTDL